MNLLKLCISLTLILNSYLLAQEAKEPAKQATSAPEHKLEKDYVYYDDAKTQVKIETTYYKKEGDKIMHGPSKSYYKNGQVSAERSFSDGIIDGIENHFNEKGEKELSLLWARGNLLKEKRFKEGKLAVETETKTEIGKNPEQGKPDIKKTVKNGLQTFYYIDGKVKAKFNWKDDKKTGLETLYYKNGNKKYELTWENNVKQGIETQWFDDEKISSITNWVDNKPQGELLNYHKNGKKKDKLEFDKGVIVNERISWNDKGDIIGKCTYKEGAPYNGTIFDIENLLLLTFENGRQVSSKVCDRDGNIKQ